MTVDQGTSTLWLVPMIILAFAIVFPLFWNAIIWFNGQIGGWGRLAQRYRTDRIPSGEKWSWQYGMVGWIGYNGVLTLTANDEGLFLETVWLFSFGHPRLFIPWTEFHDATVGNFWFRRQVHTKVGFPTIADLRLPAAAFEESEGRSILASTPRR